MYFLTHVLLTYTLFQVAAAFKLPFHLPWVHAGLGEHEQRPMVLPPVELSNRIAVIGAGAGGSAAAFWISKAKERHGLDVEIDIFDSNPYIGGRSITVQPYDNPDLQPIELGGSIFIKANKNLWRATDEFGFNRSDFEDGESTMGIWDGAEFRLMTGFSKVGGWWDTLKVLWRYGWKAPTRTKSTVGSMIEHFVNIYTTGWGRTPYSNLTSLVERWNWTDITNKTTAEYFDEQGIDRKWTMEMVESATRVNYGQNADAIHAIEGMASLAAEAASQVIGGNWQLFDQFVKRSGASVYLNTTVSA
ncbi:hypothetical protein NM688_g8919 [Phlebia brevispora]|uniref:Uncharacterized protein n=1 Tax=Phlebia brevispora TaxID=194682 RepID=A0ACC1RQV9_9APHY|nr:hypothetical protein NM688_g8919 [Phlebia brevispora]